MPSLPPFYHRCHVAIQRVIRAEGEDSDEKDQAKAPTSQHVLGGEKNRGFSAIHGES